MKQRSSYKTIFSQFTETEIAIHIFSVTEWLSWYSFIYMEGAFTADYS